LFVGIVMKKVMYRPDAQIEEIMMTEEMIIIVTIEITEEMNQVEMEEVITEMREE